MNDVDWSCCIDDIEAESKEKVHAAIELARIIVATRKKEIQRRNDRRKMAMVGAIGVALVVSAIVAMFNA